MKDIRHPIVERIHTNTEYITFNAAEKYSRVALSNLNVTDVISVTASDGNSWYEVPFLAQDTVFEDEENTTLNDPELAEFKNDTPYLLKLIKEQ